jgi:DNA polymerase III sliding clamp (beta) subunit (PCNA family)
MVKKIALDEQTQTILSYMTFSDGPDGSVIGKITSQLDRKTYEKVNKALVALGGKWNRKADGHIFITDPRPHVETALDEGALTVEKDGFFQTPPEVVARMIAICGDLTGLAILEPSAGVGAIASLLPDSSDLFLIEKNPDRCALLRSRGYDVHNVDFLESGPFTPAFDRIIMNPPFEANQDMDHVRHAYTMLAPGGILVSIMSEGPFFRSDRKSIEFRDWLEEVGGYASPLPEKSFRASGTDVNTRIITIRAPWAKPINQGEKTMKTIIQSPELGTYSLEDGSKLTFRQALKENGLSPKEWRLTPTYETKTTITYTVTRKSAAPSSEVAAPIPEGVSVDAPVASARTETLHFTDALTGADLSGPPAAPAVSDCPAQIYLSLPRKDFEDALKIAVDFAGSKGYMPILTNVKLAFDSSHLTLFVTDLECYWTRTISGVVSPVPGFISTAVYASILYSEVKALDSDVVDVQLAIDKEARTISVNGRCSIHTSDPDEFPEPPTVNGPEVEIIDLPGNLKKVAPAISTDQTRYILNGAQFDFAGGKIVGTDGFRLHHTDIEPVPGMLPIILPSRAVSLIIKHGSSPTLTIDGTDERKYISYPLRGGVMVSRLLEGMYPDWRGVLPGDLPISVEFDPKDFFRVVEGVIPIAGAKSTISLTVNGCLSIETQGDCGKYHWQIPCSVTGKDDQPRTLNYNLKYFTDALKAYTSEGPALLELPQTYGATRVNQNAIVMPIRQ